MALKSTSPVKTPARLRLGNALTALLLLTCTLYLSEPALPGAPLAEAASGTKRTLKKSSATSKARATKTTRKKRGKKLSSKRSRSSKKRYASARKGRRTATYSRGINARAALLIDANSGEILYDKNATMPMPIASLTKLMTAMVFLETEPDLSKRVLVSRADLAGSGKTQIRVGEVLSLRDLLHLSLLASDNAATKTLVRTSGIPQGEFLQRMNRKAQVMGLHSSRFVEFTGLSEMNVASALDMAQILKAASHQPLIQHITTLPEYSFRTTTRTHHLVNTNRLARFGVLNVHCGKTGFINESGYCLASSIATRYRDVIAVVLGAPSNQTRFTETRKLVDRLALTPVSRTEAAIRPL